MHIGIILVIRWDFSDFFQKNNHKNEYRSIIGLSLVIWWDLGDLFYKYWIAKKLTKWPKGRQIRIIQNFAKSVYTKKICIILNTWPKKVYWPIHNSWIKCLFNNSFPFFLAGMDSGSWNTHWNWLNGQKKILRNF